MSDLTELAAATVAQKEARARLLSTATELQDRLEPERLIGEARRGVRRTALTLADTTASAATRRPGAAAAVIGAIVLLLARRPIARLLTRPFRRKPKLPDRHDDRRRIGFEIH